MTKVSSTHLFIGGPFDGKVFAVPADAPQWNIEFRSIPNPYPASPDSRNPIHTYRRVQLTDGFVELDVFVHADLPTNSALSRLITSYTFRQCS